MAGGLIDVLVVGAGPTGLTVAAELAASGVRARLIDRGLDRVHESRALAIQPRSLEVLAALGVTDELIAGETGLCSCACTSAAGSWRCRCSTLAWVTPPTRSCCSCLRPRLSASS